MFLALLLFCSMANLSAGNCCYSRRLDALYPVDRDWDSVFGAAQRVWCPAQDLMLSRPVDTSLWKHDDITCCFMQDGSLRKKTLVSMGQDILAFVLGETDRERLVATIRSLDEYVDTDTNYCVWIKKGCKRLFYEFSALRRMQQYLLNGSLVDWRWISVVSDCLSELHATFTRDCYFEPFSEVGSSHATPQENKGKYCLYYYIVRLSKLFCKLILHTGRNRRAAGCTRIDPSTIERLEEIYIKLRSLQALVLREAWDGAGWPFYRNASNVALFVLHAEELAFCGAEPEAGLPCGGESESFILDASAETAGAGEFKAPLLDGLDATSVDESFLVP